MKDRISEKIRKLLAIVEDPSASEAEKATALSKAASLARQHDLNLDECAAAADTYRCEVVATFRRLPAYYQGLASVLTKFFSVRVLTCRRRHDDGTFDTQVDFFGSESNRAVAIYVWTYLKREFLRRFRKWKEHHGRISAKHERGFYEGLAFGLITRLREEQRQSQSAENALILASDELNRRMKEKLGELEIRDSLESVVSADGFRQGKDITIRRGVRTSRHAPKSLEFAGSEQ